MGFASVLTILVYFSIAVAAASDVVPLDRPRPSIFDKNARCHAIDIPGCRDLPYNMTIFPNPLFADNDEQTLIKLQSQVVHFKPLAITKCNPHIQFFICSAFAPMCPEQMPQAVTSCRSVCEEVRRDCEPILTEFEMQWPKILNCNIFPEEGGENSVCMRPPELPVGRDTGTMLEQSPAETNAGQTNLANQIQMVRMLPACPSDMVNLDPTDANGTCAFRCDKDALFSRERKEQAKFWLLSWSITNAVISLFTALSVLIDWERFRFPERCVLHLSLCCLCQSLPFLSRLVFPFEHTSCSRLPTGESFLIQAGYDNLACVLSFLLNYYPSMAANTWWLTLTFTWYLSATRKWAHEEIQKRSGTLHLLSWGVPAILSVSVLVTHSVDASEMHGVCSVGNSSPTALVSFVLAPRVFTLLCGILLTFVGFGSMRSEKESFKKRGTDTSRLEKYMCKMSSFSALYILPASIIILCDSYHFFALLEWYPNTIGCKQRGGAPNCDRPHRPLSEPCLLGAILPLAICISASVWVISTKTLRQWWRFLCCCGRDELSVKYTDYPTVSPVLRYEDRGDRQCNQVLLVAEPPTFIRHPSVSYSPRELVRELPPPPPSISHSSAPKYYTDGGRAGNEPYIPLRMSTEIVDDGTVLCKTYNDKWNASKVI